MQINKTVSRNLKENEYFFWNQTHVSSRAHVQTRLALFNIEFVARIYFFRVEVRTRSGDLQSK